MPHKYDLTSKRCFAWFPHRCWVSKKIIWLKYGVKQEYYVDIGQLIFITEWVDAKYFFLSQMRQ